MIVKREWVKYPNNIIYTKKYVGYFLFGFIPIYISVKEIY